MLAGFVEPGESLEQTVAREVLEESGVRVRGARYLASQPWPFPGSLMLGFIADAHPDEPVPGDELEDVRWFDADSIRAALAHDWNEPPVEGQIALSTPISISRWLIETVARGHRSTGIGHGGRRRALIASRVLVSAQCCMAGPRTIHFRTIGPNPHA